MDVQFMSVDLRRIARLDSEALVLPLFEDERPLRGPLGLVDWRLCGFISEQLQSGRVVGSRGEVVLLPGKPRLAFDKLVLLGLGRREEFDEQGFEESTAHLLVTLERARVRSAAVVLPGRVGQQIGAERAMEMFFRASSGGYGEQIQFLIIDDTDSHRVMAAVLAKERRVAQSNLA